MHDKLLNRVLAATMRFFDVTPLGRILNRFSRDTSMLDSVVYVALSPHLHVARSCASTWLSLVPPCGTLVYINVAVSRASAWQFSPTSPA